MVKKNLLLSMVVLVAFTVGCTLFNKASREDINLELVDFHDFYVTDIHGDSFALSQFKGSKVMIVNVASKCGLTPQYEALEALYRRYSDQGFVIIGFPANNFMNQEPGTNEEILEFCTANFDVTFPMMSKISVLGEDQHPLYTWLTTKRFNGVSDSNVRWNFQKYLINEEGLLVGVAYPRERPDTERIIAWIEEGVVPGGF